MFTDVCVLSGRFKALVGIALGAIFLDSTPLLPRLSLAASIAPTFSEVVKAEERYLLLLTPQGLCYYGDKVIFF